MLKQLSAISLLALMVGITPAQAQPSGEAPRWLRFAAISPDGEAISFTHRGQIFVVPADGGLAVPVSNQRAYSHHAVWSSDSEKLAFASDLSGDDDVYVTDFSGALKRLTFSSAAELPSSFSPDGQEVLFEALRLGDADVIISMRLRTFGASRLTMTRKMLRLYKRCTPSLLRVSMVVGAAGAVKCRCST